MVSRVLLATLLLASTASAQVGDYGAVVASTEGFYRNPLGSGAPGLVTFIDNGNNGLSSDDALFLSRSNTLDIGDVALNGHAGFEAGRQVPGGNARVGSPLESVSGSLAFMDGGGGTFGPEDVLVWDQAGTGHGQLTSDDVVLSGAAAGGLAQAGMAGFNAAVQPAAVGIKGLDLDGSGDFSLGDGVYVDMNNDGHVTVTDVRITAHNNLAFAEVVSLDSPDRAFLLQTSAAPTAFQFIDYDGDGVFSDVDFPYLGRPSNVAGVRLVASEHGAAGSLVRGDSGDANAVRQSLGGELVEAGNGDGRISSGEVLAFRRSGSATLSSFDIVLSGGDAGSYVRDTPLSGAPVTVVSQNIGYLDVDGNAIFSLGDIAYYDGDADGFVSVGDVQLSEGPAQPTSTNTQTGPPHYDTGSQTQTDTTTQSTQTSQTQAETETDGNAVPTVWLLPAIVAALLVKRRW